MAVEERGGLAKHLSKLPKLIEGFHTNVYRRPLHYTPNSVILKGFWGPLFFGYNSLMGRFLGIDFGSKRVGVALSDESKKIAMPLAVLPNDRTLFREIKGFCESRDVEAIVMGESKDFKGKSNSIMKSIELFKAELERDLKLPVYLEPEFLTSEHAKRAQGDHPLLDASAAALILQSFLDKGNHKQSFGI